MSVINNKSNVLEKIISKKVYECSYWKEKCFGLTSESIIDNALELKYIGGVINSMNQPSEFICLIAKMLQLNPKEEILDEYLAIPENKYLRALTVFYIRLTFPPVKIYQKLEELYCDYRKLVICTREGKYEIIHMDEYIDELIMKQTIFDLSLPSLIKRQVLENGGELPSRISLLEVDLKLNNEKQMNDNNDDIDNTDDIFDDIKLPSDFFKNKSKRPQEQSQEEINISLPVKKQKISNDTHINKTSSSEVIDVKVLDENSPEYWLELRKKIGL